MSAKIIAEFHVKPEHMDEFKKLLVEILPGTRGFSGCNQLEVFEAEAESILFSVSEWASHDCYDRDLEFRAEDGTVEKLTPYLRDSGFQPYKVVQTGI
ncbi:MAG: antibiotic biosynthesis monooxygenase [Planctomycetota bacterium]|nr:antibiotic biosynthesis monooxygenase [Planctomycetota bacterium]